MSRETTNWECPECGGICSSGVDHSCVKVLRERVEALEKQLARLPGRVWDHPRRRQVWTAPDPWDDPVR